MLEPSASWLGVLYLVGTSFSTYTKSEDMTTKGSTRPVRGTKSDGAQVGGTKGNSLAAEATVLSTWAASACGMRVIGPVTYRQEGRKHGVLF